MMMQQTKLASRKGNDGLFSNGENKPSLPTVISAAVEVMNEGSIDDDPRSPSTVLHTVMLLTYGSPAMCLA